MTDPTHDPTSRRTPDAHRGEAPDDPLEPELRRWFAAHDGPPAPASLQRFLDRLPTEHPAVEHVRPAVRRTSVGTSTGRTVRFLAIAAALTLLAAASGLLLFAGRPRPGPATPTPTSTAGLAEASPTPTPSGSLEPSGSPAPNSTPLPILPGFTTPALLADTAAWTGLRWTKLDPQDPLGLVRQMLPWSGGYLAVGDTTVLAGQTVTPLWRSADGQHWVTVPPAALGQQPFILAIGRAGPNLVVLTSGEVPLPCPGSQEPSNACAEAWGPLQSWTSTDGLSWVSHPGPGMEPGLVAPGSLISGPAGLVLALPTMGETDSTVVAVSDDGTTWRTVRPTSLPPETAITSVVGTQSGYVAVGARTTTPEHEEAVALFSTDGQTWTVTATLPEAAATGGIVEAASGPTWSADALIAGRDGFIAMGGAAAAGGGSTFWWHSADGRHWRFVSGFPPLGTTSCVGEGCGSGPDGVLIGDGTRMIAFRGTGGPSEPDVKPGAWVSADGSSWSKLSWAGGTPQDLQDAVLLPIGLVIPPSSRVPGLSGWVGQPTMK